ncbi:ABC transporter ATP-binding protein [Leptolyngbya sp. FACHB-261]|uniref:ABC transporter ATP-binding protein n=1 Tax=Leptolyngbya sp. FACHB-261 TaxID=2692806 RepID=UPI001687025C|nr:ABC transporter ATP-binding protein [Leptolyngbya sp. FACHB-261]MBD2101454.1 ABC transporter ATP-binding protein [Leptolyngbya sp. FACHB-261]
MARSQLKQLASYLAPHRRQLLLGTGALLIVNIIGVYVPWLIKESVDTLEVAQNAETLLHPVLLVLGLACLMWVIRMASRIWLFGMGRQVEFDLKQKIFNHLLTMEPAYFTASSAGDLINRATSDVDNIRRLLGFAVLSLINTVFAYVLTLPLMLAIDVPLTLLTLMIYPVMFLLVFLFGDRLRTQQLEVQQELSDLSDLIQQDVSGIALVKVYAQELNERRAFAERNVRLLDANLKLAKTRNILFPILIGLASVSLLILLWVGGRKIADGSLTIGDFIALLLYVERLVFPTALLGFTITAYQRGQVSIDRVEAILSVRSQIHDRPGVISLPPERVRGRIEARDLTFYYPGNDYPALDRVNFTIEAGETVAIVGPIGSGKSTLANALPRLLNIAPQQLFLDGQDITTLRIHDLRGAIAYVPQDSFLFSTVMRNNIRYGEPDADQGAVEIAAKQSRIHDEVLTFPKGYDTLVGERGITLSGGQRQRTALGRALLIEAPVLVLDDALSSVDNQTATQILANLSAYGFGRGGSSQRKTVIFISHQLTAAATADRIFVMDQGRMVQSGTHASLLQQSGLYRKLWNQQKLEEVLQ